MKVTLRMTTVRKESSSEQKMGFEFNPVELAVGANFERSVGIEGVGSRQDKTRIQIIETPQSPSPQ